MGQLEKYGLYVLCLVIFLILGVAIWGEPTPVHAGGANPATAMLQVSEPGKQEVAAQTKLVANDALVDQLFQRIPTGKDGKDGKDKDKNKADAKESPKPEPGGKPAVEPPAPPDSKRPTYKVKDGDVLSTIAMKQLGSMRYVDAILKLNPKVDPRHLHVGDELLLPSKAELAQAGDKQAAKPEAPKPADKAAPGSKPYTIVDGDTYEGIAQKLFKSKARAADIEKLNPGLDPKKLRPGKSINVPVE